VGRPRSTPSGRKDACINVRLALDDRLYLKAISLARREKESDMIRSVLTSFIEDHRGDKDVEAARKVAVKYGMVPAPEEPLS
jgi:hypothetical protein